MVKTIGINYICKSVLIGKHSFNMIPINIIIITQVDIKGLNNLSVLVKLDFCYKHITGISN